MYWTLELASKLEDAPWPASKEELIDYAMRSGLPLEVIENFEANSNVQYIVFQFLNIIQSSYTLFFDRKSITKYLKCNFYPNKFHPFQPRCSSSVPIRINNRTIG